MAPTESIRNFLNTAGEPVDREMILNFLCDKISTTSKNPRHIIRTCLLQLVTSGEVIERGNLYALKKRWITDNKLPIEIEGKSE